MRIPIIKVKDGDYEHIVGTNSHDVLYVDEQSGGIQYLNIQCCEGTKKYDGEQTMQFIGSPGYFEEVQIQFVTIEELLEIATQHMREGTENKLLLHKMMGTYLREKEICQAKLAEDEVQDSGGALLF
ncbi:hypothetical protein [Enterocloster lavalensis]|uniref:hypothetical protein n=1 Tax=Enterocloster lavalensis TaxID=460384 RepID=UPI0034A1AD75